MVEDSGQHLQGRSGRLLLAGSGEEGLGEDLRQQLQGHSGRLLLAGSGVLLLAPGEG